jgi:hypothetical protein
MPAGAKVNNPAFALRVPHPFDRQKCREWLTGLLTINFVD